MWFKVFSTRFFPELTICGPNIFFVRYYRSLGKSCVSFCLAQIVGIYYQSIGCHHYGRSRLGWVLLEAVTFLIFILKSYIKIAENLILKPVGLSDFCRAHLLQQPSSVECKTVLLGLYYYRKTPPQPPPPPPPSVSLHLKPSRTCKTNQTIPNN